jgi:hypothetical protein
MIIYVDGMFNKGNIIKCHKPGVSGIIYKQLKIRERRDELLVLIMDEHRTSRVSTLGVLIMQHKLILIIVYRFVPIASRMFWYTCVIKVAFLFMQFSFAIIVERRGTEITWLARISSILQKRLGLVVIALQFFNVSLANPLKLAKNSKLNKISPRKVAVFIDLEDFTISKKRKVMLYPFIFSSVV